MLLFDLFALLAALALSTHLLLERHRLRLFVGGLDVAAVDQREMARQVAGRIKRLIREAPDPPFMHRVFSPLGASPGDVVRSGGCCSGISRLCILALREHGIRSWQVTVYGMDGNAVHCLLQADTQHGPVIVDPVYGISYVDDHGAPLSLGLLREGATVRFRPLPGCEATSYPQDPYYDFDYGNTKTANWTKSWPRRTVYRMGSSLGFGLDEIRVPWLLEWPQALLLAPLGVTYGLARLLTLLAM